VNVNRRGVNIDIDDDFYDDYSWRNNVWYVMTENGLERADGKDKNSSDNDESSRGQQWNEERNDIKGQYRYRKGNDTIDIKIDKKDTSVNIKLRTEYRMKEGDEDRAETKPIAKAKAKTYVLRQGLISALDLLKLGS
jgi:hypothetical protein